jgi:hypothetical protein
MDSALLALSQQSGIRVLFSYDLIAGFRSGDCTAVHHRDALDG